MEASRRKFQDLQRPIEDTIKYQRRDSSDAASVPKINMVFTGTLVNTAEVVTEVTAVSIRNKYIHRSKK